MVSTVSCDLLCSLTPGCEHCKNKLVVLTTEWLPWLQTKWRDSGYERFTLVWKTDCIRIYPRCNCPVPLTTTIH